MREVVLREDYPDGARETLACGHVLYTTQKPSGDRRCLLCIRALRKKEKR